MELEKKRYVDYHQYYQSHSHYYFLVIPFGQVSRTDSCSGKTAARLRTGEADSRLETDLAFRQEDAQAAYRGGRTDGQGILEAIVW